MQKLRNSPIFRAYRGKLGASQDLRSILLIAACCLTLAILGSVQFSWIKRANDAHREQVMAAGRFSIRVFNRSLHKEVSHLLTVFRADPRWDASERARRFAESLFVWHESSGHGPAIKRILFHDASNRAKPRLAELKLVEQRWEPVQPEHGHQDLEARLRATISRHRRVISTPWLSTWLYYPDYSALVRPVATLAREPVSGERDLQFEGYLVLQLDVEHIRQHILPALVRRHFRAMAGNVLFDVAFVVDDEVTDFYRSDRADTSNPYVGTEPSASDAEAWSVGDDRPVEASEETADVRRQVLLTMGSVPNPVARLGGVQRVALRSDVPDPDSIEIGRYRRARRRYEEDASETGVLPFTPDRPRLFLTGDRQHRVEVIVKHVDGSLEDVLALQYQRSLAIASCLLLLVGGAMALVVVSLRRASRLANMRMEFATAVSHELRTPVTAIRAMGDNIAAGVLGTSEKALGYGKLIRDEGRRLSEMIEQTLKLVSLDSGSDRYDVVAVDTAAVVDDAVEHARPIIDRAGFVLERSDADEIPPVLADETALKQSLGNLLSNAVKYGLPGRWVKLEVAATNGDETPEVEISVHDRGPGVAPKEVRSIFEPYYRSVSANDSKVPGSGLGLNLAKRMVHGMGGRLTLRSVPGQGSVFTIHLPVAG
ncbi:MAG: HAMP domain-containing histidine kinase [Acidobacteriia bacterium]|nr:HAMP domain-containing histidine kinase [Terriglobia bacterium]MYC67512.1 HAMP domain-containing histidine kinase [Terriglobia bacterium]